MVADNRHLALDEARIEDDARFDGLWVPRTNTTLAAPDVAIAYKRLWMVETIFRTMKSLLETRPIYHQRDDMIRGHVFWRFLVLVLRQEPQRHLGAKGWRLEWEHGLHRLDALHETIVTLEDGATSC